MSLSSTTSGFLQGILGQKQALAVPDILEPMSLFYRTHQIRPFQESVPLFLKRRKELGAVNGPQDLPRELHEALGELTELSCGVVGAKGCGDTTSEAFSEKYNTYRLYTHRLRQLTQYVAYDDAQNVRSYQLERFQEGCTSESGFGKMLKGFGTRLGVLPKTESKITGHVLEAGEESEMTAALCNLVMGQCNSSVQSIFAFESQETAASLKRKRDNFTPVKSDHSFNVDAVSRNKYAIKMAYREHLAMQDVLLSEAELLFPETVVNYVDAENEPLLKDIKKAIDVLSTEIAARSCALFYLFAYENQLQESGTKPLSETVLSQLSGRAAIQYQQVLLEFDFQLEDDGGIPPNVRADLLPSLWTGNMYKYCMYFRARSAFHSALHHYLVQKDENGFPCIGVALSFLIYAHDCMRNTITMLNDSQNLFSSFAELLQTLRGKLETENRCVYHQAIPKIKSSDTEIFMNRKGVKAEAPSSLKKTLRHPSDSSQGIPSDDPFSSLCNLLTVPKDFLFAKVAIDAKCAELQSTLEHYEKALNTNLLPVSVMTVMADLGPYMKKVFPELCEVSLVDPSPITLLQQAYGSLGTRLDAASAEVDKVKTRCSQYPNDPLILESSRLASDLATRYQNLGVFMEKSLQPYVTELWVREASRPDTDPSPLHGMGTATPRHKSPTSPADVATLRQLRTRLANDLLSAAQSIDSVQFFELCGSVSFPLVLQHRESLRCDMERVRSELVAEKRLIHRFLTLVAHTVEDVHRHQGEFLHSIEHTVRKGMTEDLQRFLNNVQELCTETESPRRAASVKASTLRNFWQIDLLQNFIECCKQLASLHKDLGRFFSHVNRELTKNDIYEKMRSVRNLPADDLLSNVSDSPASKVKSTKKRATTRSKSLVKAKLHSDDDVSDGPHEKTTKPVRPRRKTNVKKEKDRSSESEHSPEKRVRVTRSMSKKK